MGVALLEYAFGGRGRLMDEKDEDNSSSVSRGDCLMAALIRLRALAPVAR